MLFGVKTLDILETNVMPDGQNSEAFSKTFREFILSFGQDGDLQITYCML